MAATMGGHAPRRPADVGIRATPVDEDHTVAAAPGDANPAVMGDGLNPLTMR